ncbi:tetratricopeptide repeat protein [Haloferula sargassicola]|uniref:Tetratricopeptide repeat protein n=1 Tax=Haloferula sargassicola TaxID=490096 RepID=A0ABP9UM82_9BACT
MKTNILIAILALAALPAAADEANDAYLRGMEAMKNNDAEGAQKAFAETLRLRPDHPYARYQLGRLKQEAPMMSARKKEAQLASVRLPEINFEEAPLSEAVAALNAMIETESGKTLGKENAVIPNLMVQDSTGQLGKKEVTLQLKNIPANTVLNYVLDQVGGRIRYDEHATLILPKGD